MIYIPAGLIKDSPFPFTTSDRLKIRVARASAITVPKEILRALAWKIGDKVQLYMDDHRIIIEMMTKTGDR